jgi:hypothetical protein
MPTFVGMTQKRRCVPHGDLLFARYTLRGTIIDPA